MLTLALQTIDGLLVLGFALLALRIAGLRAAHSRVPQRSAWWLTGSCFLLLGISSLVQDAAGTWAFFSGPGSRVWNTYVHYLGVGNHGREMLVIALGLLLLVNAHPWAAAERRLRGTAWVAYVAALLLGSALGWSEAGHLEAYYSSAAMFNALETAVMLIALAVALPTHSMGRFLWVALAANTLGLVQNVSWLSLLAQALRPGSWSPSPAMMQGFSVAIMLLMLGVAAWRLRQARRGVPAYALLEVPEWR